MATETPDEGSRKRIRQFGAALCLGYGLLLLGLAITTMYFDHHKSRLVWTSFLLFYPAIPICLGGIGAIFKKRVWPIMALAGSIMVLAIAAKISHGRPLSLFSIAPLGIFALIIPGLIACISIAALAGDRTTKHHDA